MVKVVAVLPVQVNRQVLRVSLWRRAVTVPSPCKHMHWPAQAARASPLESRAGAIEAVFIRGLSCSMLYSGPARSYRTTGCVWHAKSGCGRMRRWFQSGVTVDRGKCIIDSAFCAGCPGGLTALGGGGAAGVAAAVIIGGGRAAAV